LFAGVVENKSWYIVSRLMSLLKFGETETELLVDEINKRGITCFAEMSASNEIMGWISNNIEEFGRDY